MSDEVDTSGWTPAEVVKVVANPFYAIEMDPTLALPHKPLMDEEKWIQANIRLVRELGPENYLRNLLAILKGDHPGAPDPAEVPDEHAHIDATYLDNHIAEMICARLSAEPNLLARSVAALKAGPAPEDADELLELEADPTTLLQAMTMTEARWGSSSPEAQWLIIRYLIDKVVIGAPSLPLEDQVTIHWRIPTPDPAGA
ncbi:hypothetical protein [Actinokineospora diospyrosa]|uniref:Uncharacterized protein n=1 Tax=Actinokineospora diospyrosa TaxID=103728 RepID=A0ABT1IGG0_9PSEU|nr:hypothetical protein [Actinokineospora diospyrosa]MCP2271738.1 hypothetical protein [Actinokineospora diospyrosa]